MEKITIDFKKVYDELAILVPMAYREFDLVPDLLLVRFIYRKGAPDQEFHCYYDRNMDYRWKPAEEWHLMKVANRNLLDQVFTKKEDGTDDLDIFIRSILLQWGATILSKNWTRMEFDQEEPLSEEEWNNLLSETKKQVDEQKLL